ncbi:4-(cytidine 5'-diphospho)-2-C-methyl-D-erythritol kinase [Candidatus Pelagibacter sp.]|nr:4-(cytidine 5'-diphospho)-2-C-methyl-D-erythritol kinase [Candidatus Pelagibacter sp.]
MPNAYHKIESLVTFAKLYDEIKIKLINKKFNKITFSGKFAKGIGKNNTITKLLKLLEKKNLLKNKKFYIDIKKNIPQKSGLGGGSMNAASILKYFVKKKIINISEKKIEKLAYKIGSDVPLGLKRKNSILLKNRRILRLNCKTNFYVLIVKPNFGCSTKKIYSSLTKYSKSHYTNRNLAFFKKKNLLKSNNSLENVVFKKYPKINKLKYFLLTIPKITFVRMTGSGSSIVAYFESKNAVNAAAKIFRKKYKNYWYIVSKTI